MNRLATLSFGLVALVAGSVLRAAEGPAFFALSVADLDASVAWYSEMLDLSATHLPGAGTVRVALLRGDEVIVELIEHADAAALDDSLPGAAKRFLVHGLFKAGFFVSDLDSIVERLRQRGASFRGEIFTDQVLGARSVLLLDNAGNVLQLFEHLPAD